MIFMRIVLSFVALVSAILSQETHNKRSFSLRQTRNPSFKPHGPAQLTKAYAKFGAPIPRGLSETIDSRMFKRHNGSVNATPEAPDIEYLAPVSIGTPPQVFNLNIDSGSSDLWVFSTKTPTSQINGQCLYDPSKSNTSKELPNATWFLNYGDDSSSQGVVYTDVVNVGGLSVENQAVQAATIVSNDFTVDKNTDGNLGAAFRILNSVQPVPQRTFFDNLLSKLDQPVWTADLKYHEVGSYDFGYIDESKFIGNITYTDVDSYHGYWSFRASGWGFGGNTTTNQIYSNFTRSAQPVFYPGPIHGIADTGTTLALLPIQICEEYYKHVPGAMLNRLDKTFRFPCSSQLPDFIYGIENSRMRIPGRFINHTVVDEDNDICFGGIQPDTGIGFSVFGTIALKAAFVAFDGTPDRPRLGFASKLL